MGVGVGELLLPWLKEKKDRRSCFLRATDTAPALLSPGFPSGAECCYCWKARPSGSFGQMHSYIGNWTLVYSIGL
ncbi:hypothetical protein GUJ93_ZPchr0009g2271 [Zizania palustris]|uniref:Uncharacterized protein n=1 Tax=Zizania palustris TaxID=103762 RepID=A0A8J5V4S3_ZIZPA|nr:hypothetical protein GUJ93_ZPchr0009g2271 [Zizania palustris]